MAEPAGAQANEGCSDEPPHGQKLLLAQVEPPPTSGAQQLLTHWLLRVQLSEQTSSTQKPFPERKLQQLPLEVQLELTARQLVEHWLAAEHARDPLTRAAQHPLLHWVLLVQASAQRPLTQNPSPCWKLQQSPLVAQVAPTPTQLAAAATQLRPVAVKPALQLHSGSPARTAQTP